MRTAAPAAAVSLLLAAPAGAAAASWSPPQTLSGAHTSISQPRIETSADGTALASWQFFQGEGNSGRAGYGAASRGFSARAFGPSQALLPARPFSSAAQAAGPETYGSHSALLATLRQLAPPEHPRSRLAVRSGNASGDFGRARTIRDAARIVSPSLAVNPRGDAALAWFEDRGTDTDRVYVSLRRAGHAFGAPRKLATGRIRGVAAAIGARGDALVAWDARGTVGTRFKPRGRSGFRATQVLRSEDAFFDDLHPVVTPSGRAAVAWSAQFLSEGGDSGPVFFQAAVRPPHGRFDSAQLLERLGTDLSTRPIDAVADSAGAIVVAWTGAHSVLRTARTAGGGRFGAAQDVSAAGERAQLSDLAAGPGGRLVAVWDAGVDADPDTVRAALAPAGGRPFGPPEDVSPAGHNRAGSAAFDPRAGQPTVVWSAGRVAQAATRSG